MCHDGALFSDMTSCKIPISVADSTVTECLGIGTVKIKVDDRNVTIASVKYVPGLISNLLSVSQLVEKGLIVTFKRDLCQITNPSDPSFAPLTAHDQKGLFVLGKSVNLSQRSPSDCLHFTSMSMEVLASCKKSTSR